VTLTERIEADEIATDEWRGLYREKWNGLIVPDAIVHPAKFSRALIRHIYQHAVDCGWVQAGGVVVDPFGGVALGAFEAMRHGLHWTGVELEPRFVALGEQNIGWWNERYGGKVAGWGTARIVQGDSRRLGAVFGEAGLVVSSPPYMNQQNQGGDQATHPGMKWADGERKDRGRVERDNYRGINYGTDPANLGNLRASDADHRLVVSSPPYAEGCRHTGGRDLHPDYIEGGDYHGIGITISSPPFIESLASDDPDKRGGLFRDDKRRNDRTLTATYGSEPGQLGAMPAGELIVSSPPYEGSLNTTEYADKRAERANGFKQGMRETKYGENPFTFLSKDPSGLNNEQRHEIAAQNPQVGALVGDTFWSAARQIVAECHAVLPVGGHCVWVTKRFVRKGQIVDFTRQWVELCEAVGFRLLHHHRAMLVETHGKQAHMDGDDDEIRIARKSFFRQLHERKRPDLAIDWEDVTCMVRL
jgi:hypothetical protein